VKKGWEIEMIKEGENKYEEFKDKELIVILSRRKKFLIL